MIDLVLPQEALHLRREYRELGTPDWISASRDGSVVAMGVSPADEAAPSSAVVVFRGPELREAGIHRFSEFFPRGYVAPDGATAYVFRVIGTHAVRQRGKVAGMDLELTSQIPDVEIRRLDLATGRLTPFIAKTDALTWVAFPAGVPVAYAQRWDRRVMRIDLTSAQLAPVEARELRETYDIAAGPGPGEVLFGGRRLIVWDAAKERVLRSYSLPFEAYQVGATADGTFLFAADRPRNRIALIHRESGRVTEIALRAGETTSAPPPVKGPEPAQLDHRLGGTGLAVAAARIRTR